MRTSCPFLVYESRLGPIQGRLIAPTPANESAMNRVKKLQSGNRTTRRLAAAPCRGDRDEGQHNTGACEQASCQVPASRRVERLPPSLAVLAPCEGARVVNGAAPTCKAEEAACMPALGGGRRQKPSLPYYRRPPACPPWEARRTQCGVPYRNCARHVSPSPCRLATLSMRLPGSYPTDGRPSQVAIAAPHCPPPTAWLDKRAPGQPLSNSIILPFTASAKV